MRSVELRNVKSLLRTFLVLAMLPMELLAQEGGFALAPLVRRGDSSPDGGHFFNCKDCESRINGWRSFNDRRAVGLYSQTEGACFDGIFLVSRNQASLLADFCHDTPVGKFSLFGPVNLNQAGDAAFLAGPLRGGRIVSMIFIQSDGQVTKAVAELDPTPEGDAVFGGCGFSEPSINNNKDVAFMSCAVDKQGSFHNGVFLYSSGQVRRIAGEEPTPIGGTFNLNFFPATDVVLNNPGDVLFQTSVFFGGASEGNVGLFLRRSDGFKKIIVNDDPLPGGLKVDHNSFPIGDLNDSGEVAFTTLVKGGPDSGIFRYSGENDIRKIITEGDPTPVGGRFASLNDPNLIQSFQFIKPRINNHGSVAFKAKVKNGSSPIGIFLGSPRAVVRVAAVGDRVPTGEVIKEIDTFAMNDAGDIAFVAYGSKRERNALGVYMASPVPPEITKLKLKHKSSGLQLLVTGKRMVTNDTVIEIDSVPLEKIDYPSEFQQDGGFTTRATSRDARLERLIPAGRTVQVTVFNPLTNQRSAPVAFTL